MVKQVACFVCVLTMIVGFNNNAFSGGTPDTYGVGARAMGLGGAFTAVADDYSAAYYNPAGLGQISGHQLTGEFIYTHPTFEVQKLSGGDLIIYNSDGTVRHNPTKANAGHGLDLKLYNIGILFDLDEFLKLPMNATAGIAACLPKKFNSCYVLANTPPDQPVFIRYGDNIDRVFLTGSGGAEILPDILYVGGGLQGIMHGTGYIMVDNVDLTDTSSPNVNCDLAIAGDFYWDLVLGGLVSAPGDMVKVGFCWKDVSKNTVPPMATTAEVTALGIPVMTQVMAAGVECNWSPQQYSLGISATIGPCMVSLQADKQLWSQYEYSPNHQTMYEGGPDFEDIINKRVGLEFKPNDTTNILLGFAYQPTPIPNQSYRISNYLDMDKQVFSFGFNKTLDLPIAKKPVKIGGIFQYHRCKDYTVYKDGQTYQGGSANPDNLGDQTQVSYTVDGDVFVGGISATLTM